MSELTGEAAPLAADLRPLVNVTGRALVVLGGLMLVPALVQDGVKAEVSYIGPLKAPLAAGAAVGTLKITVPDLPDREIPLITEAAVEAAGFLDRLQKAALVLQRRFLSDAEPAS